MFNRLIIFIFLCPLSLLADEAAMISAYQSFKDIQQIVNNNDLNKVNDQRQELLEAVSELNSSLRKFKTQGDSESPLSINLQFLLEEIDNVEKNLKNNNNVEKWSVLRLRSISTHCQNCHTGNKVEVKFKDSEIPSNLKGIEKADFLLASRQFEQAEKAYWDYILKGDYDQFGVLGALYRWLDIMVRVNPDPDTASKKLKTLLESKKLYKYETVEVASWYKNLKQWAHNGGEISEDYNKNESLIKVLLESPDPLYSGVDTVSLLRAAAGFQRIIEKENGLAEERRKSLLNIGMIYTNIPVIYLYELPELYLKSCIKQYPGTKEAQKSFSVLKQYLTFTHTGSGGIHLDSSTRKELAELSKLAFGDQ